MTLRQVPLNITLRHEASFDSFVAEAESLVVVLYQLQMAIVRGQGGAWYFHGPDGAGKTHLLQAACRFSHQWERRCVYLDLDDEEIRRFPELIRGLEAVDVLCLDGVDAVLDDPTWQAALGQVLLQAHSLGHIVLMAGQHAMGNWPLKEETLAEALSAVVPVPMTPLGEREAVMLAVQRHGQVRGLLLSKRVVGYLVKVFGRDLEAILKALQEVEQASLVEKQRITLPFVKRVLSQKERAV